MSELDKQIESLNDRGRTAEQWRVMYDAIEEKLRVAKEALTRISRGTMGKLVYESDTLWAEYVAAETLAKIDALSAQQTNKERDEK